MNVPWPEERKAVNRTLAAVVIVKHFKDLYGVEI